MSAVITQNGCPNAVIVLSEKATELEKYAAEELQTHIKKVSNADIPIVTEKTEGTSIVIGTPDSVPELTRQFPEDITWLSTLRENGRKWAEDGFAVREADNTVYIFGITPRGMLNGVYDFIEENLGVLWIRAKEDIGLVYDPMPTVTAEKVNYREKSPFEVRGWHLCFIDKSCETERLIMRNKLNTISATRPVSDRNVDIGMNRLCVAHNMHALVKNSPLYDPEITEYRNTDDDGNPLPWEESDHVNFFSDLVVNAVAASVIEIIEKTGVSTVFVGNEDHQFPGRMAPHDTKPFEYAPGEFVTPECENYYSTVFYTFLNKVSGLVRAKHPDAVLQTFAYKFTKMPPQCRLESNIHVVIAAIQEEDLTAYMDDPTSKYNVRFLQLMEDWKKSTPNLIVYNYYGCYRMSHSFERPIWYKMQKDLQYYADGCFTGPFPEGVGDCTGYVSIFAPDDPNGSASIWGMNALTFWLFSKLSWNPHEDVSSLIELFCRKVYGGAWEDMHQYYTLLLKGWTDGRNDEIRWDWDLKELSLYMDNFIVKTNLTDPILRCLRGAWEKANDVEKARIRRIKEVYENYFAE